FFVGAIQEPLQGSSRRGSRSIQQLQRMLEAVDGLVERPVVVSSVAVYDKTDLVLAIQSAAENFHDGWRARLGKAVKPAVSKEHWTRVKALTRRLAEGWSDEYDTLKPVADLHLLLQQEIYKSIQSPSARRSFANASIFMEDSRSSGQAGGRGLRQSRSVRLRCSLTWTHSLTS